MDYRYEIRMGVLLGHVVYVSLYTRFDPLDPHRLDL